MTAWRRLAAAAAIPVALAACRPAEPPPAELLLPALPDLAGVDPAVGEQLRERHHFVARLQAGERTTAEGLAWGFGRLAKAYHAYTHLERARACYANAHRLEPREHRWAYYLGHLERTEGNFEVSSAHFEVALTLRPDHLPALVWLAENELDRQRPERAEARFKQALDLDADNVRARAGLGRAALERGDFAASARHLEAASAAQPEASALHYALGLAYRGLGDEGRSRSFFARVPAADQAWIPVAFDDPLMQEVSDLRDSGQYHVRLGQKAVARGRFQAAVDEFEQAVAADPDRPDARYNLAASLLRLGRRRQARAALGDLVERFPGHVQTRVLLARMLIADGAFEAAERHLRHALASDPAAERAHLVLGDVLRQAGRLEAALASYAQARELAPDLAAARFGAAAVLIRRGSFERAAAELEQGLAALPGSRELELLLARLLAAAPRPRLRDGERALQLARVAVRGAETVADAETLAMALAELGRFEEAVGWQRAALARLEPSPADVRRLRQRLALYQRGSPCREPWAAGERLTAERVRPVAI